MASPPTVYMHAGHGRSTWACAAGGKKAVSDALSGLKDALGPPRPGQTPNSSSIPSPGGARPAEQSRAPVPDLEQGSMKPPGPDTVGEMSQKHNVGWHDSPDRVWSDAGSWPDGVEWSDAAGQPEHGSLTYVQSGASEGFSVPEYSVGGSSAAPPGEILSTRVSCRPAEEAQAAKCQLRHGKACAGLAHLHEGGLPPSGAPRGAPELPSLPSPPSVPSAPFMPQRGVIRHS